MIQLRPDFTYMDRTSKRKRETDQQDASSEDEAEAGPSTAQQVTVKFKQAENERWKKAAASSFKTLQRKSQEEPWVTGKWHMEGSAISEVIRVLFYSPYFSHILLFRFKN